MPGHKEKDRFDNCSCCKLLYLKYTHEIVIINKYRNDLRTRAQELAARTTTVHGDTSDSLLGPSIYNEALHNLGLYRGLKSEFVPGHCFFSSIALSSPRLPSLSFIEGARAIRLQIAAVYRGNSFHGILRPWMAESSFKLWPGHANDKYSPPGVSLSIDGDEWQHHFYLERAQMMESVNVNKPTSSLWEYSNFLDHISIVRKLAQVLASVQPLTPLIFL